MKLIASRRLMLTLIIIFVSVLILLLLILQWSRVVNVFYPFVISIFIAYLLNPLVCMMEQRGIKRSLGIIIIYLAFISILVFICFYMIPQVVTDIGKLTADLPRYSAKVKDIVQSLQENYSKISLPEGIRNAVNNNITRVQGLVTSFLESLITSILNLLSKIFSLALIPILVYYFLKDYKNIGKKLTLLLPHKYRSRIIRICTNIDDVFGSYIRSQVILSLIIAVMTSIVLMILQVDFALIIGILNGITNIIPYFGPIIGAAPAVVIAFLQSPIKALYTLIAIIIIQQVESDIICPKITADIVGLHPLSVIFAMIIGGELFGMTGLILGIPAAAAIKVIYIDITRGLF